MRLLSGRSPAHGFCDDEQTRRLLRSRPPRQALAWAAARLGGRVVSARAPGGGMSSAVHLITVNRIKMLNRQMYGRARFDLLRERVLLA
jgi:hypothetical protein